MNEESLKGNGSTGRSIADGGWPSTGRVVRRRRKAARPAEIIEAGLAEFAEKGFVATRLEDVARRAGVAKGTIYLYFPDKQALFLAAARARLVPVQSAVEDLIAGYPGTTRALLTGLIQRLHREIVGSDLKVLLQIMVSEGRRHPDLVRLYYAENVARAQRLLAAIVARGIARGEVRPGPAADLPLVLIAPAIMAAFWSLTFGQEHPIDTETFLAAHLDLVLDGISREAKPS